MKKVAALWIACSLSIPAWAADPTTSLAFGDFLMVQKRFPAAEIEYERLATLYPDDPRHQDILMRMFNAAEQAGQPAFTLNLARAWEPRVRNGGEVCIPQAYAAIALYQLDNYPAVLAQDMSPTCAGEWLSRENYLRGLSRLRLKDWSGAPAEFTRVGSPLQTQATEASAASVQGNRIEWKSPGLAGTLSALVPGSGYLYDDRPQTAAAAFVVSGLFIGGTYSSARSDNPGLAALLALLSLGWYTGGIYGSVQAAHRENALRLDRFVRPFEIKW